jgi:hypothetical protein
MNSFLAITSICVLATAAGSAAADVLVGYDTSAVTGSVVNVSPSTTAPHTSGLNLTRGAGLNANSQSGLFSSTGWDSSDASDYMSFGLAVDSGFAATLSQLTVTMRSASSGPGTIGIYYSGDGFAVPLQSYVQDGDDQAVTLDLSSLPSLTGTIEFRLLEVGNTRTSGTGATTSSGTFRINGPVVSGAVSAIPAPSALGLIGCGVVVGGRRRRR